MNPAHGPNKEGCCLNTEFGCCPDNISPAEGPDNKGCGCEFTEHGCCPDDTTTARGPNFEGCGCVSTENGCCPDKFTPSPGPNMEGCPCHTYEYGCCPDGVSIARGPGQEGCTCKDREFGCCPDRRTPASVSFLNNIFLEFRAKINFRELTLMVVDVLQAYLVAVLMVTLQQMETILRDVKNKSCQFLLLMCVGWRRIEDQKETLL